MIEEWRPLTEHPGYSISTAGRITNDETGRIRKPTLNQQGVLMINLNVNGFQRQRGVALLVAKTFIPNTNTHFNTPINMDGNRENCDVRNLAWRPRWFAVEYHRQFDEDQRRRSIGFRKPIMDVETEEVYKSSWDAAVANGLLDKDIYLSILNHTIVFPTFQKFVVVEE